MSNLTLTVSIMNVSPGHQVVQKSIVSKCVQLLTCLLTILTYCHSGFVHFPFRVMSCLSTGASDSKVNVISLTIRGNIYGICLCFIAFIIRWCTWPPALNSDGHLSTLRRNWWTIFAFTGIRVELTFQNVSHQFVSMCLSKMLNPSTFQPTW